MRKKYTQTDFQLTTKYTCLNSYVFRPRISVILGATLLESACGVLYSPSAVNGK